jgi:hypothetical protein
MALSAGAATPWKDVEMIVDIYYDQGEPYGPFEASGSAVDAGLICATGDTLDIYFEDQHRNDDGVTRSTVLKRFDCEGSGTFDVRSNIINNQIAGFELVFWSVVDGTGDYEGLRGNGTSVGEGTEDPNHSVETFTGRFS